MSPQSRNEDMERAGALLPPGLPCSWHDRLDSTNTLAIMHPPICPQAQSSCPTVRVPGADAWAGRGTRRRGST